MTEKVTYKEPSEEQLKLMQDFANICSSGIEIIMKCEVDEALKNASTRLQEAMHWFHAYVINGGALKPETTEQPKEVSPTMAANRIVTIN